MKLSDERRDPRLCRAFLVLSATARLQARRIIRTRLLTATKTSRQTQSGANHQRSPPCRPHLMLLSPTSSTWAYIETSGFSGIFDLGLPVPPLASKAAETSQFRPWGSRPKRDNHARSNSHFSFSACSVSMAWTSTVA